MNAKVPVTLGFFSDYAFVGWAAFGVSFMCLIGFTIWHFKKEADIAKDALHRSIIHDSERVTLLKKDTKRQEPLRHPRIQHEYHEEDLEDDVWEDDLNHTHIQSSYFMNPHIQRQQRFYTPHFRQPEIPQYVASRPVLGVVNSNSAPVYKKLYMDTSAVSTASELTSPPSRPMSYREMKQSARNSPVVMSVVSAV